MKNVWILCSVLLISVFLFTGCGKSDESVDNTVYVKTQKVASGMLDSSDNYSGEVKGRYETNLSFQVSGKILARNINIGDKVSAGDVLMVVDDKDIKQNVNSYNAQLESAKSQLSLAQSNLARYQQLYASNAVSAQELDQYQNAYNSALAAYNQASAQATEGYNNLGYTQLKADNAGVISNISAEVGQVVSAGQTVAVLVQDGEKEVEISIPENKIQTIHVGQKATVTFWALQNTDVEGIVREIAPMADAVAKTYKVRITLVNPPDNIQLGMTSNVTFSGINDNEGIILPLSALYQTENKTQVWVVDSESKVQLKDIKVINLGKNDVTVSGLNKGDVVVIAGVHKLYEGESVKLTDGDTL